jgi:L-seryl-tRNA(Ser) seleniumtransferase
MTGSIFRQIPSVSDLLEQMADLVEIEGQVRVADSIRYTLAEARNSARMTGEVPETSQLISAVHQHLLVTSVPKDGSPVINATGVIIHTNLGRAVLSNAAQNAMLSVARDYSALEYDLNAGERGRRGGSTEELLCAATDAEAALVVNNCAAAAVLMLAAIARSKGVIVSRGQLVEIGGGFRVPEILEQSGASLIEVGTTNRTRSDDYLRAMRDSGDVGAILHVHSSNFKQIGFTQSVSVADLVALARSTGISIPVLADIGSGALIDTAIYGLAHEPMPIESVHAGADIVAFSGDKLLGGPQAGILAGRKAAIDLCRSHPLARAFRADKFTLSALRATILHYLRGEAVREIPVWRMISMPVHHIENRSKQVMLDMRHWLDQYGATCELVSSVSTVGGGTLPGDTLPTVVIAITCASPDLLTRQMRLAAVPVIGRIQSQQVLLDLRTVLDDKQLIQSICAICK